MTTTTKRKKLLALTIVALFAMGSVAAKGAPKGQFAGGGSSPIHGQGQDSDEDHDNGFGNDDKDAAQGQGQGNG